MRLMSRKSRSRKKNEVKKDSSESSNHSEYQGYREETKKWLLDNNLKVWDVVQLTTKDGVKLEAIILPRSELAIDGVLTVKLPTGYNTGIRIKSIENVKKLGRSEGRYAVPKTSVRPDPNLPKIPVLGCGGTIASRLDYRTGGVIPAITPDELFSLFPEVAEVANVQPRLLFDLFSESMTFQHYRIILQEIESELQDESVKGIVLTHGTDTMSYTAAAVSFAIDNLSVPIVLTGSQRSSDRPSSDAFYNFMGAVQVAARADLAEVVVVMHEESSDSRMAIHRGVRVRKMHTSRRTAFQSISTLPLGNVDLDGTINWNDELLVGTIKRRSSSRQDEMTFHPVFEDKTTMLYFHPNQDPEILDFLVDKGYKGIVLLGTGLGHVNSQRFLPSIERAIEEGVVLVMTSQCIHGFIGMTVYETGRDLLKAGVIPGGSMLPEVAFVKLAHGLARYAEDTKMVRDYMLQNVRGEHLDREIFSVVR